MRARELNWMHVEEYLKRDDRVVLPVGSTEQHGYLSLETDNILAERVSTEAAEPLGVLVLPVLPYGLTPSFQAYPGSPTLRLSTYLDLLRDLLDSLYGQGFRRFLLVNGHGGNAPVEELAGDGVSVHHWWRAPRTAAAIAAIDPDASHASWMESFPWTRVAGVELPEGKKEPAPRTSDDPAAVRAELGDGSFGGFWSRPAEDERRVWETGVAETRAALESLASP